MERSKEFGSFFADASGGEGERCNYPTRPDTFAPSETAYVRRLITEDLER